MAKKKRNVVRIWKPMAGSFFSIVSGSVTIGRGSETMLGILAILWVHQSKKEFAE
jgi:hypothetical protein